MCNCVERTLKPTRLKKEVGRGRSRESTPFRIGSLVRRPADAADGTHVSWPRNCGFDPDGEPTIPCLHRPSSPYATLPDVPKKQQGTNWLIPYHLFPPTAGSTCNRCEGGGAKRCREADLIVRSITYIAASRKFPAQQDRVIISGNACENLVTIGDLSWFNIEKGCNDRSKQRWAHNRHISFHKRMSLPCANSERGIDLRGALVSLFSALLATTRLQDYGRISAKPISALSCTSGLPEAHVMAPRLRCCHCVKVTLTSSSWTDLLTNPQCDERDKDLLRGNWGENPRPSDYRSATLLPLHELPRKIHFTRQHDVGSGAVMQGRWKRKIPEKTRRLKGIAQHDSYVRKPGSYPAGNRARFTSMGSERSGHCVTAAPFKTCFPSIFTNFTGCMPASAVVKIPAGLNSDNIAKLTTKFPPPSSPLRLDCRSDSRPAIRVPPSWRVRLKYTFPHKTRVPCSHLREEHTLPTRAVEDFRDVKHMVNTISEHPSMDKTSFFKAPYTQCDENTARQFRALRLATKAHLMSVAMPSLSFPRFGSQTRRNSPGRRAVGGVSARALASEQSEPCSITGRATPDFCTCESCRAMLLFGGFSHGHSISLALAFRRRSISTSFHPYRLSIPCRRQERHTLCRDAIVYMLTQEVFYYSRRFTALCPTPQKLADLQKQSRNNPVLAYYREEFERNGVSTALMDPSPPINVLPYGAMYLSHSHVRIVPDDAARCQPVLLGVLPFTPVLHSGAATYSPRFSLIGSQDLGSTVAAWLKET
ncbi:hypothetical protein PR048_013496 [Dryococelus australis]|uniref:Uncharacterized protein n=1 Tax=Dryococelus australis TaxID=614101 RepID=A0ABQ9HSC5_9NEOP|nr:hypothetical protein PR048_013496 [Dryococelus australis]